MSQSEMHDGLPLHLMTHTVSAFSQVAAHLGHMRALPHRTVPGAGVQPAGCSVGRGAEVGPEHMGMVWVQHARSTVSQCVMQSGWAGPWAAHDVAHCTWLAKHCCVHGWHS